MVLVEGLAVVIAMNSGLCRHLQQAPVMDVGIGIVDEHAGLHVAVGVDVEIVAAAGDAAAHKLAVVLEVHGVERVAASRRRSRMRSIIASRAAPGWASAPAGVVAHGHVVEVEAEVAPLSIGNA